VLQQENGALESQQPQQSFLLLLLHPALLALLACANLGACHASQRCKKSCHCCW
jgi:hypothetical protein